MPNHVVNVLKIKNQKNEYVTAEVIKPYLNQEGLFDFNLVIKRPDSLDITSGTQVSKLVKIIQSYQQDQPELYDILIQGLKDDAAYNPSEVDEAITHIDNLKRYGHGDWYSWSIDNWGTKWNCYAQESINELNNSRVEFQTAWSTPNPIWAELSRQLPDYDIEVEYADEDLGHNCGIITYKAGVLSKSDYGHYMDIGDHWRDFAGRLHYGSDWEEVKKEWDEEED